MNDSDRVQHVINGLGVIGCVAVTIAACVCAWYIIKWFKDE